MRDTVKVTELDGRGPRVVMLPGLGNRGAGFLPLAKALSSIARPVVVEYPEGRYAAVGVERLARQVSEAIGPVDAAIGSSFGGMVAGSMAVQRLVRGAAFISAFTRLEQIGWRGRAISLMGPLAMVPAPAVILASVAARRYIPRELAPDVVPTTAGERSGVWHRSATAQREGYGNVLRDLPIPCIAIQGGGDLLVPPGNLPRLMADLPPGSPWRVIAGAGHVAYLTHIEECMEMLRPWIAAVVTGSPGAPARPL